MKLSKMQNQTEISFLDSFAKEQVDKQEVEKKAEVEKEYKQQPAQKLDNSKAIENYSGKAILNAGGGGITNDGGSSNFMGSKTNNSIWNSSILEDKLGTKDSGEVLKEQNEKIEKLRNGMRQESLDELAKSISETETRKASSISSTGGTEIAESKSYKKPSNNISIFDDLSKEEPFSRLAEKTDGEKVAEQARTPKEKDDSWRQKNSGTKKMSSLMDSLFDNLANKNK